MTDPWEQIDWVALERLRNGFLENTAGRSDYWQSRTDLISYDLTYAQRIGWKWDYVLSELKLQGWLPPTGATVDWGCGTGIAHRAFFRAFPQQTLQGLHLIDRSERAVYFALERARQLFPELDCSNQRPQNAAALLISHVLTELDEPSLEALFHQVQQATTVIWVEPGTFDISHRLIAIRERLRAQFEVVAPCVHSKSCGLQAHPNHWCHFFASPPAEVFTSPHWAAFSRMTGIDLRSLPLSYLVLDKRTQPQSSEAAVRILGRPRLYKAYALVLGCEQAGALECRVSKRSLPEAFRAIKKDELPSRNEWSHSNGEVQGFAAVRTPPDRT